MQISICTSGNLREFIAKPVTDIHNISKKIITKYPYSLSTFKDNVRNKENFIQCEMIGLDFDSGLTLEQAKELFGKYKHIIAPTKSHQKEKNGIVCDRFRVILFLSEPITDNETFESTWYWVADVCPSADRACKDASRYFEPSISIYSENISDDAILWKPAPPQPKPEKQPVQPTTNIETKGTLARRTLDFLLLGAPPGTRHVEIYAAARDAYQNRYTESWFIEQLELLVKRTGDEAFTDDHAIETVASAYSKDPKHEPRLKEIPPRAFTYKSLGDILSEPDKQEDWVVDNLLMVGGTSIVVGAPKIGKTTLVRQLERSVLRGDKFLGRVVKKGKIIHYSFDEKAKTAKRHYRTLGLNEHDPLILHFGQMGSETHLNDLEEDLNTHKPTLAVVDTLFDMADVEDVNSYIPIKKKLTIFSSIAERTGCHILFIHHQNKPNQNYRSGSGNSVLGSQAIFGSVDCCMIFERTPDDNQLRKLSVEGRGVDDFEATVLRFSKETQVYNIERAKDPWDK
jgi:hypothetical protein